MATKARRQSTKSTRHINKVFKRPTLPAQKVGVTLTISDEALKKIDDKQLKTIKAAQEDQNFSWR